MTYVNQEALFAWYSQVSRAERINRAALLDEVFQQYCRTHVSRFTLPADRTRSGRPETYEYRFEDLGKCGGNSIFLYF